MNKFVIYTALTGGYDKIEQPLVIDERFDYVLFTDNVVESQIGIWQVREIPYKNGDLTRVSRYPKMHPEDLLSEYKASVYHDANIKITSLEFYDRIVELYESNTDWAGIQHPYRDCIYDEAYQALAQGLDREDVIFRWCHRLRQDGYPRHHGLNENNIIYRRHNEAVRKVDEQWWNLYEGYTRRDQLTLMYVLWKQTSLKLDYILPPGESSWNSNKVQIVKHEKKAKKTRGTKQSFLEHARGRCRTGMEEKSENFSELHYWLYGLNPTIAKCVLILWGWYALIVYGPIVKYRAYKRHKKNG